MKAQNNTNLSNAKLSSLFSALCWTIRQAYLTLQHASRHPRVDGSTLLFDLLRSAVVQLPPAVAWNHPLFT